MMDKITMIELFSGIGAQERALRQLGVPYEITNTCDCDKDAVLSYASMRSDFEKELTEYDFPSQDKMIEELQTKNVGFDFQKGKHTITSRTPIDKLKQYYLADKLSHNLGDISKVEKLPYADLVTYSYPCTDLSVAGKGEGMVNKCDKCDGTWPIDFEKPEINNICPNCGNIDIKSTRSGLLGQVQRLLTVSYKEGTLPKYLLLENVKNLVGKKFKPQFDAWVNWLNLIGYNTYYKVLNAKHYGIPQNRERIFAVSIRKDIDDKTFKFSEQIPLTIRLKDVLEKEVDEKYYLPDERIDKILNSTFMQEKKRIQMTDVCDTLLARDWKDPKCVPVEEEPEVRQLMNIMPGTNRDNPNQGRVYDVEGISPALTTMEGGNRQPFVIDEIKVVGNYMPSNHDASRVVDIEGIAPTVKENHGTVTAIAEPQTDIKERFFRQVAETILENQCEPGDTIDAFNKKVNRSGVCPTITTRPEGFKTAILPIVEEQEPFIVASRGRNPENPSDRTVGAPTEQRLEPNFSGCTNTLTSVQKDNYVCEPQVLRAERTEYGKAIRKQYEAGEIDEKIGNMREMKPRTDGVANTITTLLKDNYVAEPLAYDEQNEYMRKDGCVGTITTDGSSPKHNNRIIEPIIYDDYNSKISADQNAINTLTTNGDKRVLEPEINPELVGGIGEKNFGKQYRQGNRVYNSEAVAMALNAQPVGNTGGYSYLYAVEEKIKWRIRKLTTKECWRLMGFSDLDHDKAAQYVSNSALYKQAGNSICTCCLVSIFYSLFFKDSSTNYQKYLINFND